MMMFASKAIMKLMEKFEWIQRLWLLVIIHTALNILTTTDITSMFLGISISIRWLLVALGIITYLYIQNVVHVAFHLRKHHLHNHIRLWIITFAFLILLLSDFIPELHNAIHTHIVERLTILFVSYMMLLELIMQQYSIDKHYLKHQSKH
jgi:predicted tellurium resistance membrane protein TerC